MEYRNLGRTGIKVSPLCLGNLILGERPNEQREEQAILDTATSYGRGANEERVGRVLREGGKRHRVVLATNAIATFGTASNQRGAARF